MTPDKRRKVLIIGLDGGTFDVILPLLEKGKLPHLGRLMREGTWGNLSSVVPPVTPAAWSSFATGANPGRHSIYDFRRRKEGSYSLMPNSGSTLKAPTLWEMLSQHQRSCCVINVPMTYPVRPINGEMIAGIPVPGDMDTFTYPKSLEDELRAAVPDYAVWPASVFIDKGLERAYIQSLFELTDIRKRTYLYMDSRRDWDFRMIHLFESDAMQHVMWHHHDPSHPHHDPHAPADFLQAVDDIYIKSDEAIGEILETADEDTSVLVMSDHGFGPNEAYFHTNIWLMETGLLKLKPNAITRLKHLMFRLGVTTENVYSLARTLKLNRFTVAKTMRYHREKTFSLLNSIFLSFADVDWDHTTAYSVGNIGQIFINLEGREPQGCVAPADYDQTVQQVIEKLNALRYPGTDKPLMGEIVLGREYYSGPYADQGPDIVFFTRDLRIAAFGVTEFASNAYISPPFTRTGWHRMNGILIARGSGIRPGQNVDGGTLWDICPTVMALMGLPVPAGLDGRVLESVVNDEVLAGVTYSEETFEGQGDDAGDSDFSDEEEAEITSRLKGLGYV